MSRRTDSLLAAGMVMAWLLGVALFPRALEPGKSEENGVVLNLLVDSADGHQTNDWFRGAPEVVVTSTSDRVDLHATKMGLQLVSRALAVFPNECYALLVKGRAVTGMNRLFITDEDLHASLRKWDLQSSLVDTDWRLTFRTEGLRRIAVVFFAETSSEFELNSAALVRMGKAVACD